MPGGGAGGKEVGRISIRVVPNLDRFREELYGELKAIEKETEGKVPVKLELKDGEREKIAAETKDLPDAKVKVKVDVDSDLFQKRMLAELAKIHRTTEAKIPVSVDGEHFRREMDRVTTNFNKNARQRIDLDPEIATAQREKMLADVEALKMVAGKTPINIKLKVDPEFDYGLRHRVSRIRPAARIPGNLDGLEERPGLFRRAGNRFLGAFQGGDGGASGGMSKLSMLGNQTFWIVGGVVALLAPALALLATSLASLPALIAAVALPIGAVALGVGGFKKALENVGLLGEGKKGKTQAGEQLKALQKSVSDEFERGLTPIFQQLVGLLPMLTQGFTGLARGIVADIQGLSDAFTKGNGPQMIQNIFRNVGEMLSQAAPAMNSFASSILNLASHVSNHLPGLARFFDEWGSKFSNWVDKISGDGTLDKAVSGLKPVADSLMNFVAQMMDSGIKLMADPAMAANIKTVFDGITNFVQQSLPALNQLFAGIADIIHMLHLDGPSKPLEAPKPGAPGQPAPPTGPYNVEPPALGSGGKLHWVDPPGPKPGVKPGFLDRIEDGSEFQGLVDLWNKAVKSAAKVLDDPAATFKRPHTDHPTIVEGNVGGAPQQKSAPAQAPAVGTDGGAGAAGGQAQAQAGAIQGAFAALPGQLQGVWGAISSGAKGAFTGLVQAAQQAVQQISAALQRLPGEVTKALSGMRGAGESAGRSLGEGMAAGIADGKRAAVAAAQDLAAAVNAVAAAPGPKGFHTRSPSKVWQGFGQNLSQGLGQGISDGSGDAVSRAQALAGQINDAMNNGTGLNTKAVGQQIKQALAELTVQRDQLQAQVDALPKGDKAGKAGLRAQLNQIKQVRDQLSLERDQLKLGGGKDGTGSDSMTEAAQMITQGLAKTIDAAKGFVMANVTQFEHDVGIGGNGAIPKIAEFGLGWGQQLLGKMVDGAFGQGGSKEGDTHFHVGSKDEAVQAHQTLQNRKSMQWKSR